MVPIGSVLRRFPVRVGAPLFGNRHSTHLSAGQNFIWARCAKLENGTQGSLELAGTAFLPWEKWFAWLVHKFGVAIRRRFHRIQRQRSLSRSESWPQVEGTVEGINLDMSNPREEVVYSYLTPQGYRSGSFWHWFDSATPRQIRVGDRVVLRFNPSNHDESVFLQFSR
jgi:hypothetical protein